MNLRQSFLCLSLLMVFPTAPCPAQRSHGTAPVAPSESIPNLGPLLDRVNALRSELREYHACTCKCGCYAKDLDLQADRAIAFLRTRAARRRPNEKLALVLDIDETTLSNWDQMSTANFEYNSKDFNAWVESAQAPAIPGTLRVYSEAQRLGVSVFFLTGRSDSQRASTEANLRVRGFNTWQKLIMRSLEQKGLTALSYKSAEREKIVAAGYRIVLNIGDQWSDLRGNPEAEYSVKYPDPFYFIK
ncbi:MAG: HAD family acid phosphatase [Terracidiphilus sp.]